jgi:hypothetical protein
LPVTCSPRRHWCLSAYNSTLALGAVAHAGLEMFDSQFGHIELPLLFVLLTKR